MAVELITEEELIVYYSNKMAAAMETLEDSITKTQHCISDIHAVWKGQAAEAAEEKLQEYLTEMRTAQQEVSSARNELIYGTEL